VNNKNEIYNEVMGQIKKYALARLRITLLLATPDKEYEERVKEENINPEYAKGCASQSRLGLYCLAKKHSEIEQDLWMILLKIVESK
jgi:hypothetical protein